MTRPGEQLGPSLAELHPGVHPLSACVSSSRLSSELERAGWATSIVDLSSATGKPGIMDAIASALGFPDWFGRNWDALDEMLRDLSWWPAGPKGRAIVIEGARLPSGVADTDRYILVDVLATAVDRWASTSSPLVVLLGGVATWGGDGR